METRLSCGNLWKLPVQQVNKSERLYFLAIGGVAMGNVAILANRLGYGVSGCDQSLYPPMDRLLGASGIPFIEKFSMEHLVNFAPDRVVIGNAVPRGNAVVEYLLEHERQRMVSLPEFLSRDLVKTRKRIVISGSHGKTTTTAIAAFYMRQMGIRGGYFIGGIPKNLPNGADIGDSAAPFVFEGDEYDCAFFDKRSKFIHYMPDTVVINRIDFDHGDIFRDIGAIQRSFSHLLRLVPNSGHVLVNGEDPNIAAILPVPWTTVHRVGWEKANDFSIRNFSMNRDGSEWQVMHAEGLFCVKTSLHGRFNVMNATMAILATHITLGLPFPENIDLRDYSGVGRRQEKLVENNGLVVIEDFGHHPRAIIEVLTSLRAQYPHDELIACFEPATNTSMYRMWEEDYGKAFAACDRCFWGAPRNAAGVSSAKRLRIDRLMCALSQRIEEARCFSENRFLLDHLLEILQQNAGGKRHVVVLFSSGAFPDVLTYWRAQSSRREENKASS
ncbi:MAG: Mur ligase domain-containing protein [Puniceicoccales bacterium]|nr:Mur ligase domain-containing protein [Puniceicoccales bacterium]